MLELGIASPRELDGRLTQEEFWGWVAFFEERERRTEAARKKSQQAADREAKSRGRRR